MEKNRTFHLLFFNKTCSDSGVILVLAICLAMVSCSFSGPSRKYDLHTVVSILFEPDSSNVSLDDDVDLSDPEGIMQYACDEEHVWYIVVNNLLAMYYNIEVLNHIVLLL